MKRLILTILLSVVLFSGIGCAESKASEEVQEKAKVLALKLDSLQLQLGKIITDPKGIDKLAFEETSKQIREVQESYNELKASGASWFDIGRGAVGGVLGRTALHGLRALLMLYLPAGLGGIAIRGLSLILGGSGSATDKDKKG